MPQPVFDEQEKYILHWMKSPRRWAIDSFLLSYIVTGTLLFGLATYYGNIGFMICAFAVVCAFRLYEAWYHHGGYR